MLKLDVARTGLVFGLLIGGMHAMWAGLVAAGWGQPLLDFVFRLHFIDPPYQVGPFNAATAVLLVGLTFTLGGLSAMAFALVWNSLGRRQA